MRSRSPAPSGHIDPRFLPEPLRGMHHIAPSPEKEEWISTYAARPYFRLTHDAMVTMRELMRRVGALSDDALGDMPLGCESDEYEDLMMAQPTPDFVSDYKFQCNEAWVITPPECLIVAERLIAKGAQAVAELDLNPDWRDTVADFAAFNAACADLDGYRVR